MELAGKTVGVTAKEFDLLYHFAGNPGRVYTRSQLLDFIWGYTHNGYEHTVNTHAQTETYSEITFYVR